jgi:hypothetical protein
VVGTAVADALFDTGPGDGGLFGGGDDYGDYGDRDYDGGNDGGQDYADGGNYGGQDYADGGGTVDDGGGDFGGDF